jgi:hypothetical protein
MMATLRSFIFFLLGQEPAQAPAPCTNAAVALRGSDFHMRRSIQKGSPAEPAGHALLIAAQYSRKKFENNALFAIWLADSGRKFACLSR